MPPQGKYNGAQRIAYSAIVLMGAGSLLTGLAVYKPTQTHFLTSLFGGYEMARWFHFWLTMGFCGFFLVHVRPGGPRRLEQLPLHGLRLRNPETQPAAARRPRHRRAHRSHRRKPTA